MNNKLIKHILTSELRWKKKLFGILIPLQLTSVLILWKVGIDNEFVPMLLVLTSIVSFVSFLLTPSFLIMNNINRPGQAGSFSWKYIHSIAHDRKTFVFGCLFASAVSAFPTYVFLMLLSFLYNKTGVFFASSLLLFLVSSLACMGTILNILNFPKRFNYRYKTGPALSFTNWLVVRFKFYLHLGLHFIHNGLYLGSLFLFVAFVGEIDSLYGYIAIYFALLIVSYSTYQRVMNTWADERYMRWDFQRERKKTLTYLIASVLLVSLNFYTHGTIPGFESDIFDYISENKINELKKIKISHKDLQETSNGSTPLIKAVEAGNKDIAEYLLSKGANLEDKVRERDNEKDKYLEGFTPLMVSIWKNDMAMMNFLITKGANVNAINNEGMSVLSLASAACNPVAMEILVGAGANINQASKTGLTPLFYSAIWRGCLTSILYLRKLGADETLKNKNGLNFQEYIKANNPSFYRDYSYYMNKLK